MFLLFITVLLLATTVQSAQNVGYDRDASGGLSYSEWREFCDDTQPNWIEANRPFNDSTGAWDAHAGIFVRLPGASNERNLTYVADIPYWIRTRYYATACKFNYRLMWFVICDATSCPSVPSSQYGLWMAVQETSNKLIVPRNPPRYWRQEYSQQYETPVIPGNPDQTQWDAIHISVPPKHSIGVYLVNGSVVYEEWISNDVPHGHLSHSAESYDINPNPAYTGLGYNSMNPWIDLDYYGRPSGVFPEPANTVFNMYEAGSLPLVEWTSGHSAYMALIVPANGKRQGGNEIAISQEDYTKYHAIATLARTHAVRPRAT